MRNRLFLAAVLLSASCGTTVPSSMQGQSVGNGLSPASSPADAASQTTGTSGGGGSAPQGTGTTGRVLPGGSAGGSVLTTTGHAEGGTGTAGAVPTTGATSVPGITPTTIYVGDIYDTSGGAGNDAIGAGNANGHDIRDYDKAMAAYLNNHGGVLGRKVVFTFFGESSQSTDPASTLSQAACSFFTQDKKTFLIPGPDDILRACAEKSHGIAMGTGGTLLTYQRFPHYVDPDLMRLDRLGRVTVNGLARQGYFTGKLGLVTWDDNDYHYAIDRGYRPALAALGLKASDTAYINVPQSSGGLGDTSAAVQGAVLKFKTEGIDHVIIQDGPAGVFSGTGLTLEWMTQAKAQVYKPRYGANTLNNLGAVFLPSDQEANALVVSQADYDPMYDAPGMTNPARSQCFSVMKAAGLPVDRSNAQDQVNAITACDRLNLLKIALTLGGAPTDFAFMKGIDATGITYQPAGVFSAKLGPDQHDAGDKIRNGHFETPCDCVKLDGAPYSAG